MKTGRYTQRYVRVVAVENREVERKGGRYYGEKT